MHARHRLEEAARIFEVAGVIAIDPQPVHLAAARDLILADDRTLFSALQAATQALQPMQGSRSITMPQACRR